MEHDLKKIWDGVLGGLKVAVSAGTYGAYIRSTSLLGVVESGDRLICEVGCSSGMSKTILEQRYYGQIAEELKRITGRVCEVRLVIENRRAGEQEGGSGLPLFEDRKNDDGAWKRARLKTDYTFDNFAVGGSNQMAFAAAQAVVRKPGEAYNPLFIYGGVGVGKTHLMQAIGHGLVRAGEDRVLFCSAEEFTNDLVEGIKNKSTDRVRAKYRKVRLLLIDDVQFIAGRATVQEEFFHTFNSVVRDGGQVVMTSDRPPLEINKLEERLKSRFGAGMVVDIGPADFELKTAILLIKARQRNLDLPIEVAKAAAEAAPGLRELEGFLVRLGTEMEMKGGPATLETAERLLKINKPARDGHAKILTPNEVIGIVGDYFGVGVAQLKGDRRTKTIVWPRQLLMYLLRIEMKLSQEEVGRLIGGRDHSTVIHAERKVRAVLEADRMARDHLETLKQKMLAA